MFAGYAIESKEPDYDDFAGVDVKGRAVIILRRNPQQGAEQGSFSEGHHGISRHAALRTKVSNAFRHGAAAILFVNDPFTGRSEAESIAQQVADARKQVDELQAIAADETASAEDRQLATMNLAAAQQRLKQTEQVAAEHDPDPLMEFGYGGTKGGKSVPILHITQAACNRLLEVGLGTSIGAIEARIDETLKPQSVALTGWTARGQTSLSVKEVPVANVVGVIEGQGPHAHETIVIGAHYDHLGFGGEGSLSPNSHDVHNGADDNASGTAALLAMAWHYGQRPEPPPRRLVFIAFTGEERGLLGSAEYVRDPLFPIESTIAMFNMDMVGRLVDDELTVFGAGTSPRWDTLLDSAAEQQRLKIIKKPEGFGPSDHSSFYAQKIPVLHLFTGTHDDYHRPTDDWDKLNVEGMARIVAFLQTIVDDTLAQPERPGYIAIEQKASLTRSGSRPYFGSIPDFSTNEAGYALQGVSPGSPADQAGLKSGDIIIALGEDQIGSLDDFDLALRKFKPGEQVEVTIRRGAEQLKLPVVLGTPRS
ncbi:MAG: M28 family peptidase [Planctomycetaceae bacterium]